MVAKTTQLISIPGGVWVEVGTLELDKSVENKSRGVLQFALSDLEPTGTIGHELAGKRGSVSERRVFVPAGSRLWVRHNGPLYAKIALTE